MSVKIGHARISENNSVTGTAGDQTGAEVRTQSWWNQGWSCVLRPISATVAEKSAKFVEQACANDKIGYDQYERNTLRTYAKKHNWDASAITEACETDCAAFMAVATEAAGVDVTALYQSGNAPCTSWMAERYLKTGAYTVIRESKYLNSDAYLLRGDILVDEDAHTVMVLSNGSSSGSEKRGSGSSASSGTTTKKGITCKPELEIVQSSSYASKGAIQTVQALLNAKGFKGADGKALIVDGEWGPNTAYAIGQAQTKLGLTSDKSCGAATYTALCAMEV